MADMKQQLMANERWTEADVALTGRTHLLPGEVALRHGANARHQTLLARVIDADVIPRLLQARRVALRASAHACAPLPLGERHVTDLVALLLGDDVPAVEAYIAARGREGRPPESLCLDLLSPAARQLGELWEQDICDFAQVTLGLHQLHRVLFAMRPAFDLSGPAVPIVPPRALLVPMPGEQHSFGLAIVVQFMRRAGWHIWSGAMPNREEMVSLVRRESFDAVGLSVACADRLDDVAATIRALRAASCNRAMAVMVGGPAFVAQPDLAALAGADATARDGREAVQNAAALLATATRNAPDTARGAAQAVRSQQLTYTQRPWPRV